MRRVPDRALTAFGRCQALPVRAAALAAVLFAAAASAAVCAAQAEGPLGQLSLSGSKEPIQVESSQLELDYQHDRVVYRGKVHAVQGDLKIDSETLTITYVRADGERRSELKEVVAEGNVTITSGTRRATGGRAVFAQAERRIVLTENPVIEDGPNRVTGERVVVLLDEGRSIVESSAKKRVEAVLYPGSTSGGEGSGRDAVRDRDKPGTQDGAKVTPMAKGATR